MKIAQKWKEQVFLKTEKNKSEIAKLFNSGIWYLSGIICRFIISAM